MHTGGGTWCGRILTRSISFRRPESNSLMSACPSRWSNTSARVQTSSPFSSSIQYCPPTTSSSSSTKVPISVDGGVVVPLGQASRLGAMASDLAMTNSHPNPSLSSTNNLCLLSDPHEKLPRAESAHLPHPRYGAFVWHACIAASSSRKDRSEPPGPRFVVCQLLLCTPDKAFFGQRGKETPKAECAEKISVG